MFPFHRVMVDVLGAGNVAMISEGFHLLQGWVDDAGADLSGVFGWLQTQAEGLSPQESDSLRIRSVFEC